ncbi:MAG: type II secretion system protein [Bacilli bacterium]|nr:type II secretion system protein [Bacilli bacterium]
MFKLNNKGFTLIEILAVIVIISILGGIAVMGVLSSINNSKDKAYEIMISNIVTASRQLYDEVDNSGIIGGKLYKFSVTCDESSFDCSTSEEITIVDGKISVNLQTLVSNGFLDGINNKNNSTNNNKKILLDPKDKKDLGGCEIIISKSGVVPNGGGDNCPTEYKVLSND